MYVVCIYNYTYNNIQYVCTVYVPHVVVYKLMCVPNESLNITFFTYMCTDYRSTRVHRYRYHKHECMYPPTHLPVHPECVCTQTTKATSKLQMAEPLHCRMRSTIVLV